MSLKIAVDSRLLRQFRRTLGGHARSAPDWRRQDVIAESCWLLVRVFYGVTLAKFYGDWKVILDLPKTWPNRTPQWPVMWLDHVDVELGSRLLLFALFAVGIAVLALPKSRLLRCLAALGVLQVAALHVSWGVLNHGSHEWIWLAAMLCFLPNGQPNPRQARAYRQQTILVFASCAAMLLMFYTMSGAYKVWFAVEALINGRMGGFSPEAMAKTVASRALETRDDPLLAPLLMMVPWAGWPLFLTLYYVEFFAIVAAYRQRLLPVFGLVLILFHLGTAAFMGIAFPDHVLWNTLFLLLAPHAVRGAPVRDIAADLPLVGWVVRLSRSSSARAAAASGSARPAAPDS